MVKRWIIMIVLFFCLIFSCIFENKFVNNSFYSLVFELDVLQDLIYENINNVDIDIVSKQIKKIKNNWNKNIKGLRCVLWHSWLKDIENGLAKIPIYLSNHDYNQALAEISSVKDSCLHYIDDYKISIENIL